jgi:hypothetical protein
MDKATDDVLSVLEDLLPGLNYVVFLELYRVGPIPGGTPAQYITAALGTEAQVAAIQATTGQNVLDEVERCLRYPGDHGHGPKPEVLASPRFNDLLDCLLQDIERSIARATTIATVTFRSRHPLYAVMWGFAYLFVRLDGAEVLLGANSD